MFFPTILSFTMLLATAAADLHASCVCDAQITKPKTELTEAACNAYNAAKWKWGSTTFDKGSSRCNAVTGAHIAGDQWEEACQTAAKSVGFKCEAGDGDLTHDGLCFANPSMVRGAC